MNNTFWADGQPSVLSDLGICTIINNSEWYTANCSAQLPYVCKVEATAELKPERSQPQYQVRLRANFSSDTGEYKRNRLIIMY